MRALICLTATTLTLGAQAPAPVTITTANGLTFAASWSSAAERAPAVVFFPMCWATPPETWAPVAAALSARGVSTLIASYPGWPGNSPWPGPQPPPEPQQVYWQTHFRAVADAAYDFAATRSTGPIVIAGSSCGVERALDAAMRHPARIAGIVAFAGAHTPEQLAYLQTGRVPVLAVTSAGDRPWPEQHRLLTNASGHPASRLIIRDESGHGTALLKDRPELTADIAGWIAAQLGTARR